MIYESPMVKDTLWPGQKMITIVFILQVHMVIYSEVVACPKDRTSLCDCSSPFFNFIFSNFGFLRLIAPQVERKPCTFSNVLAHSNMYRSQTIEVWIMMPQIINSLSLIPEAVICTYCANCNWCNVCSFAVAITDWPGCKWQKLFIKWPDRKFKC